MKYKIFLLLIFIVVSFSGCLEQVKSNFEKVDVVHVKVGVAEKDNKTSIQSIEAKGGEMLRIQAPGFEFAQKFPAINVEVLQQYMESKGRKSISMPNGQSYTGPGNYSFTVRLYDNALNKSRPLVIYSEVSNTTSIYTRAYNSINWTD